MRKDRLLVIFYLMLLSFLLIRLNNISNIGISHNQGELLDTSYDIYLEGLRLTIFLSPQHYIIPQRITLV